MSGELSMPRILACGYRLEKTRNAPPGRRDVLFCGAKGEAVELDGFPFNKRGFVGPILIQREPVPPRDFLPVVLGEPHAHDELVVVQIDLVHEILEDLVSNLRVVHVGVQELVEVRLDAVPVLV